MCVQAQRYYIQSLWPNWMCGEQTLCKTYRFKKFMISTTMEESFLLDYQSGLDSQNMYFYFINIIWFNAVLVNIEIIL